jgi:N utilization substance protein A
VPSEHYQHNDRLKVYVTDVVRSARGLRVCGVADPLRTLIKRLCSSLEVPEIAEGIVEITKRRPEPA